MRFLLRVHPDPKNKTNNGPLFWWDSVWLNQVCWGEVDCEAHWSVIYCAAHRAANHHSLKRTVTTTTLIKAPVKRGSRSCKRCRAAGVKWRDDMEAIWSWVWCNLIGLSLHIKQRYGRGRNDVYRGSGGEETERSGKGRDEDMEIKEGREVKGGRREETLKQRKVGWGGKGELAWKAGRRGGGDGRVRSRERRLERRKKDLPWLCALEGKWETRTSNTSGAHKHHRICPVDNILQPADLQREKEDYDEKIQSERGGKARKKGSQRHKERGISVTMNAIQLQRASVGEGVPPCPHKTLIWNQLTPV